jgi:hypothetical protein
MGMMTWIAAPFLRPGTDIAGMALDLRDRLAPGAPLPQAPRPRAGYDRLVDGLNRLPRPFMALGTLALIFAAMIAPDWFAARMEALSAMPEALWWLIGAVISLYFGSRIQIHAHDFQREIVGTLAGLPELAPEPLAQTPRVAETGGDADLTLAADDPDENAALRDWMADDAAIPSPAGA